MTIEEMEQKLKESRQGKGKRHMEGRCGPLNSLCPACGKAEFEIMKEWNSDKPGPETGEDIGVYWRRIGGKFYDEWFNVARLRYQAAGLDANTGLAFNI